MMTLRNKMADFRRKIAELKVQVTRALRTRVPTRMLAVTSDERDERRRSVAE